MNKTKVTTCLKGLIQSGAAGGFAAAVWGLQEPIDKEVFKSSFSDVAFVGKFITHHLPWLGKEHWYPIGFAVHVVNGAAVGVMIPLCAHRFGISLLRSSISIITVEHLTTFPLTYFTDRYHPASQDGDVGPVFGKLNAFGQASYRHLLFGIVAGVLSGRIS